MPVDSRTFEAVILAGGKGSRLRPLTDNIPKPLVAVDNKPILKLLLIRLQRCGIKKVTLAVNHLWQQIQKVVGDGEAFGLQIEYSRETEPLSTVAPLKNIENLPENFLVINGDILTDLDFSKLALAHSGNEALVTVATYQRKDHIDYGVLNVGSDGMVDGFREKPIVSLTVSMGAYVFSREVLELVPSGKPFGFDDLMELMLHRNLPIATFPHDGYWLDIGRPEDYLKAQQEFESIRHLFD